jgi:hypothetical protein
VEARYSIVRGSAQWSYALLQQKVSYPIPLLNVGDIPMKKPLLMMCAFVFVFCSTTVFAFDDERKGFILGAGVGGGFLSHSFIEGQFTQSDVVFLTDFKIGGAPSNILEVYFIAKSYSLG